MRKKEIMFGCMENRERERARDCEWVGERE